MKSSARKVELASASDLFSTEQERQDAKLERVQQIPLTELFPFPDHPFSVRDDDSMKETVESLKESGVLQPAIARPREGGGYELVSGHRRKRACELAGLTALPALVRNLDDDTATILMVDSNIQRENILPSERAQAYKMKLEAIKRRAGRPTKEAENNSPKISANFRSDDEIGAAMGVSGDTVRNYISLTQLVPELQQMVDDKKIAMTPAVELSYLKPEEQQMVTDAIAKGHSTPSLVQAQQLKKISRSGGLDTEALRSVMTEGKKPKRSAPARAKPVTPPQEDTLPPPPQDTPPEPPPFQLGGKSFATIQESVQDLKNMDKDCSCTPDIFLAAITEFVKRFQSEISCYADEYYAPVFPALSPVQLRYLRQQMDTIRNAADQLYILIEGKIENE